MSINITSSVNRCVKDMNDFGECLLKYISIPLCAIQMSNAWYTMVLLSKDSKHLLGRLCEQVNANSFILFYFSNSYVIVEYKNNTNYRYLQSLVLHSSVNI